MLMGVAPEWRLISGLLLIMHVKRLEPARIARGYQASAVFDTCFHQAGSSGRGAFTQDEQTKTAAGAPVHGDSGIGTSSRFDGRRRTAVRPFPACASVVNV